MDRRSFLKSATATGLTVGLAKATANASIPEHNWDKYDWGSGPPVPDRLYQGPFPQYGPVCGCSRQRCRDGHVAIQGHRQQLRHGAYCLRLRRHRSTPCPRSNAWNKRSKT